MNDPVDAVVVNYNAGFWLQRCLDALLAQPAVGTVVVVDNGSTDGSAEALDPARVTLVRNADNLGFARAANQGVAGTAAGYVLLLNPDLELGRGAVDAMRSVLDQQPRAGIVGAWIRDPDGGEQRACRRRLPTLARALVTALRLERFGLEGINIGGAPPAGPQPLEAVSGALLLLRRACWDALGGLDEGYFLHCEDLDLFARAREAGWEVWLQPLAHATHAKGWSQRGARLLAERHKRDGMLRYFQRFEAPRRGRLEPLLWRALIRIQYLLRVPFLVWQDRRAR